MDAPLTVVTFKWKPARGYRSQFTGQAVNVLRRMVGRHYAKPHRFVCVTDDAAGIDTAIEIVPLWNDFATVPSPHGGRNPSCYRRLKMFAPEMAEIFGPRFVSLDLDTVIVRDITPLWDRPEDLVMWGDTHPKTFYNGSMMLMTAGCRPFVWTDFDPRVSPKQSLAAGCYGSDQGWVSYRLGPGEKKWSRADGVYSYRNDIRPNRPLPENAKVVFFHGNVDPWSTFAQRIPWVREHYH